MVDRPPRDRSVSQSRMARSHGQRSSSVSGVPADILSMLAWGWNSSASAYGQPRRSARICAVVVFPDPETPMITRCWTSGIAALLDVVVRA